MVEIKVPMARPSFGTEERDEILKVVDSGWLAQGKKTKEFENLLSNYLSSKVVIVNNGSSALMCSLIAHGIKPGDKVIVPSFTYLATSSVPKLLGAEIIPADIDPQTLNISSESVEQLVKNHSVKMVMVVDVGGLSVDLNIFFELAKKYNFTLFEDAAEALGSEYRHKKLGSFDHTTIFSFHIAKQITTIEGGCITTKNKELYEKIKAIRDMGRTQKGYVHAYLGSNFRTTDIQSAIGIQQIKKIDLFLKRRDEIAEKYRSEIKRLDFQFIPNYATRHTHMIFFVLAKNSQVRDKFVKALRKKGIDARLPWLPVHMQPCNQELRQFVCKNAEDVYEKSFTIPIFNSMEDKEIELVTDAFDSIEC